MKAFAVLVDYKLKDGLTILEVTGRSDTEINVDLNVQGCFVAQASTVDAAREIFARCEGVWVTLRGPFCPRPEQGRVWGRSRLFDAAL